MRAVYRRYVKSGFTKKPKQMTEERYNEIIYDILKGDLNDRDEFILGFVMLTVSIAGAWAAKFPVKQNDIIGVAYVALMECVEKTITDQTYRTFDAFSAYLHSRVRGAIINMIRTDYIIKPPGNSVWFIAEVAKHGADAYKPFLGISNDVLHDGDNEVGFLGKCDANFDFSEAELLESPWLSSDEKIALQMRLNGKTHEDISRALALSRSRVTQIFEGMRKRVEDIVRGQD